MRTFFVEIIKIHKCENPKEFLKLLDNCIIILTELKKQIKEENKI